MVVGEEHTRVDALTGSHVIVTPWRQDRPHLPQEACPFCPGGQEAPEPYDVRHIVNRWPALPGDRHEVVLHSPDHEASFLSLGEAGTSRVLDLWSRRTAALGARPDVAYVFVFENRGRAVGATIDHPHSQILAFGAIPPIPLAELDSAECVLCRSPAAELTVSSHRDWFAYVPWAPSWPFEMLIVPRRHVAGLPAAGRGQASQRSLAAIIVDCLTRLESLFGPDPPYMLWIHQAPVGGGRWPAAHLHLHLVPAARRPGLIRHLAAAELGAGCFFDPVDPLEAAAMLREAAG